MQSASLWGDTFELPTTQEVIQKVKSKTKPSTQAKSKTAEQLIQSKSVSIENKIELIKNKVYEILGVYANNTIVIYDKADFQRYIDCAIANGVIAIDTETNNSLDPMTCKIMGLCIYTDGQKNAYIPINHVDMNSGVRLENQLTEEDIKEQLSRLSNTLIVMHNAPFDYRVIGMTCGIWLDVKWDTRVAAKLFDENSSAKLKDLYVTKIDNSIEKYNINSFFDNIEFAVVPPEIFSLYAATDAYMTYKLYLYQKSLFDTDEYAKMYQLFQNVEMPIDIIAAKMENLGVCIDVDYANRLAEALHKQSEQVDIEIQNEIDKISQQILNWRLTPEANYREKKAKITKDGREYNKSKNEQLSEPINVSSNTQLAILIYDVLKMPSVDKDKPRGVDSDILEELSKYGFPLGDAILKKRGIDKLLSTYVEAIPAQISPTDNRLHAKFDTQGTKTGRFSSSGPNL